MTYQEMIKYINKTWVSQICCGNHRFIDITIVQVEGRFFVRQYKFRSNSWYDAFLKHPEGVMKLGDILIPIKGIVPLDLDKINPKVNKAYFKKMNIFYPLMRLTYNRKKHEASTLELIPQFSDNS